MEENGFWTITFDSEVQMTSSFHCCTGFYEIFNRTPLMTMMLYNWGGAKWPKMAQNGHLGPFWAKSSQVNSSQIKPHSTIV